MGNMAVAVVVGIFRRFVRQFALRSEHKFPLWLVADYQTALETGLREAIP